MKTKAILIILTLTFVLSLAACDGDGQTEWVCMDMNMSFTLSESLEVTNAKMETADGTTLNVSIQLSNDEAKTYIICCADNASSYIKGNYSITRNQITFSVISTSGTEFDSVPAFLRFKKA